MRVSPGVVVLLIATSMTAATPPAAAPKAWLGFGYSLHNFDGSAKIRQWLYVEKVAPGSPAMQSGLRVQDAIVSINGRRVQFESATSALKYFASLKPGTVLRLSVIREGKPIALSLRAQELPEGYSMFWRHNRALATEADGRRKAQ